MKDTPRQMLAGRGLGDMFCAIKVLPARMHTLLLNGRTVKGSRLAGDVLQYVVEVGGEGLYDGQKSLELLIEEPPQVHLGELPPVCSRDQGTIICQISQTLCSADGMFRLRLPLQIETPPLGGYPFSVYIPAWLLVDNCSGGICRPDDRRPPPPPLTEIHVTDPYWWGGQWLLPSLVLGLITPLVGWLVCHRHGLRRLSRAGMVAVRRWLK